MNYLVSSNYPVFRFFISYVRQQFRPMSKTNIEGMIRSSIDQLHKTQKDVEAKAEIIQKKAKDMFDSELRKYQPKFEEIERKAKEKGKDISHCLKHKEQFAKIPNIALGELNTCLKDVLSQSKKIVEKTVSALKKIDPNFPEITKRVSECTKDPHPAKCLEKVIGGATESALKKVQNDSSDVKDLLNSITKKLDKCVVEKAVEVGKQANKKVNDFATCAGIK